jgi:predicted ATPase
LERQFRRHRAILLHAMGGMGKTTLATEAAHWWTRTGLFPDGACFVSFEQASNADRVVQVLGEYLEGVSFNSLPADEQRRRAIALFQQKCVLFVWDNFESVLPQFNQSERSDGAMENRGDGKADDAAASNTPPLHHSNTHSNTPSLYPAAERQRLRELFRDLTDAASGAGRLLVTCRPLPEAQALLERACATELHGLARHDSLSLLVRVLERVGVDFAARPAAAPLGAPAPSPTPI